MKLCPLLEHIHYDYACTWSNIRVLFQPPLPPALTSIVLRTLRISPSNMQGEQRTWYEAFKRQVKVVISDGAKVEADKYQNYFYLDGSDVHEDHIMEDWDMIPAPWSSENGFDLDNCPEFYGMVPVALLGEWVCDSILYF
jgi:hypothetical protein